MQDPRIVYPLMARAGETVNPSTLSREPQTTNTGIFHRLVRGMINYYATHLTDSMPSCSSDVSCSGFLSECYDAAGMKGVLYAIFGHQGSIEHPSHRDLSQAYVDMASMSRSEQVLLVASAPVITLRNLISWRGHTGPIRSGVEQAYINHGPIARTPLVAPTVVLLCLVASNSYGRGGDGGATPIVYDTRENTPCPDPSTVPIGTQCIGGGGQTSVTYWDSVRKIYGWEPKGQ